MPDYHSGFHRCEEKMSPFHLFESIICIPFNKGILRALSKKSRFKAFFVFLARNTDVFHWSTDDWRFSLVRRLLNIEYTHTESTCFLPFTGLHSLPTHVTIFSCRRPILIVDRPVGTADSKVMFLRISYFFGSKQSWSPVFSTSVYLLYLRASSKRTSGPTRALGSCLSALRKRCLRSPFSTARRALCGPCVCHSMGGAYSNSQRVTSSLPLKTRIIQPCVECSPPSYIPYCNRWIESCTLEPFLFIMLSNMKALRGSLSLASSFLLIWIMS